MKRKFFVQEFLPYYVEDWKIIFIDEAAFLLDHAPKKGWYLKGKNYQLTLKAEFNGKIFSCWCSFKSED